VRRVALSLALMVLAPLSSVFAQDPADWPTFGNGPQRQNVTPHRLPAKLAPEWEVRFPEPRPAFWSEPLLVSDRAYEPVVVDDTAYLGLNSTDEVVALDLATGRTRWRFYAFGPVRRPPAVYGGRVYLGSDNGQCYCLDAATGKLIWKFNAAPAQKFVLGNGRIISQWPVRSDVLVTGGRAYFGAGQWPFMGTYLYCLDAKTGKLIWRNDDSSFFPSRHPHGGAGMSGLSAMGPIALVGKTLVVSNGRTRPMRFDAATGKRLRFESGWQSGCTTVVGAGDKYFNGSFLFDLETCTLGYSVLTKEDNRGALQVQTWQVRPVVEGNVAWTQGQKVRRWKLDSKKIPFVDYEDKSRYDYPNRQIAKNGALEFDSLEESPPCDRLWIKAADQLFASMGTKLLALSAEDGAEVWSHEMAAEIGSVIAARGKLLVSTVDGRLTCFGADGGARQIQYAAKRALDVPDAAKQRAAKLLATAGGSGGCALVAGIADGSLVKTLAQEDFYRVVAFDADAGKIAKLHAEFAGTGLLGTKVDLVCGNPAGLPPYLMKLVCSETDLSAFDAEAVFHKLRPYGGRACYEGVDVAPKLAAAKLASAKVVAADGLTVLSREGALPGSSWWDHDCGTAGHTLASEDTAVRGPLGVTWYGGPAAGQYFINRHSGAPRSQVVQGRLYCQKIDLLTCYDAYTGELLWQRELPGLASVPKRRAHVFSPRAFVILGGNMVTQPDAVYVETGTECLVLDPLTGKTRKTFRLPGDARWGCLQLLGDVLIVLGDTMVNRKYGFGKDPWNGGVHRTLFALDRHSGKLLWKRSAEYAYRSSGIALGNGKAFVLDFAPEAVVKRFEDIKASGDKIKLLALDVKTGAELWTQEERVTGAWIGYSRQTDILLDAPDKTVIGDKTVKLNAWQGDSGKHLYTIRARAGAGIKIIGDRFLTSMRIWDIRTGRQLPLWLLGTGRGCLTIAGPTMLTMRTSSSGYIDLSDERNGLVALPGFRTSCFGSLIPADGLLNAPNEGTGCVCNYNLYTPLALAHMPGVMNWGASVDRASMDRLGINFGAPGDRTTPEGTNFYHLPATAWARRKGMCPIQLKKSGQEKNRGMLLETIPAEFSTFSHPPFVLDGQDMTWVGASGATGLQELKFVISSRLQMKKATLRFYFCEFEATAAGQRVFDVAIGGKATIRGLDVFKEAGGAKKVLIREVKDIDLGASLEVTLTPVPGSALPESLLSGLEFIKQE
jgi:outer membrane protein assembly factor BamB